VTVGWWTGCWWTVW